MPAASPELQILGIDLSVQPASTGVCDLTRTESHWSATFAPRPERTIDHLVERVVGVLEAGGRVAIDSPFGWPRAWSRLLGEADEITGALSVPQRGDRKFGMAEELRWRETDSALHGAGLGVAPLSASMDKLAATTAQCVEILVRVAGRAGQPIARDGSSGIHEVYPAASMAAWRIQRPRGGKDGRRLQHVEFREQCIAAGIGGLDGGELSEHDLDALAAALTIVHPTTTRPETPTANSLVEGIIHLPGTQRIDDALSAPQLS